MNVQFLFINPIDFDAEVDFCMQIEFVMAKKIDLLFCLVSSRFGLT